MDLQLSDLSTKRLFYFFLVICTAYVLQSHQQHPESLWLLSSAAMLSLITLGDALLRRVGVILLAGLIICILCFCAASLAKTMLPLALYLFGVTVTCVYIGKSNPDYSYLTFIINFFTILSAALVPGAHTIEWRALYIAEGACIAAVLQLLYVFHFTRNEWRDCVIITLRHYKKLTAVLFSCLLDTDYSENIYLFERRVHRQKIRCLRSLTRLRELEQIMEKKARKKGAFIPVAYDFERTLEIMLDCAQLRRRVSDYTIFQLSADEFAVLSVDIQKIFGKMIARCRGKKSKIDTAKFIADVKQLEANYNSILQVTAREPLVFLLFLDGLKSLSEEMEALWDRLKF